MTAPAEGEPTLTDIQHEHPQWLCWEGWLPWDGGTTYYARRADLPYRRCYQIKATDPASLRERIRAAGANADDDLPLTILGPPFGPGLPPGECGHPLPPQPEPDTR
jgi:hypothetical protein